MPSPYVVANEVNRNQTQPVGFEQTEPGTVAEVVSAVARTDRQPWRADFRSATLDTVEDWQDPVVGSGMTVAQVSGGLAFSTGTTAGVTSYVRSKRVFRTPVRAQASFTLSQRIANQEFYIELVTADGNAFSRWKFDGLSATVGKVEVGTSSTSQTLNSTVTILTTASAQVVELDLAIDESNFRRRAVDSNAAAVDLATRTNNLPHPDDQLYLQFRAVNLSTAPTSSTTFTLNYLIVQDVNELAVEVVGGRGGATAAGSVPVAVTNTATIQGTVTPIASSNGGGLVPYKLISAASTNAANIKASAGRIYGVSFSNTTTTYKYVKFYNTTTAPTVGTTVPLFVVAVPPNNNVTLTPSVPITMGAGISISAQGGFADTDSTAIAVGDLIGEVLYV